MRYPPRLSHLASRSIVVAKLAPTYAEANSMEDEEVLSRLDRALQTPLLDELLSSAWAALMGDSAKLNDEEWLTLIASALKKRPHRPGKVVPVTAAWSAFMVLADVRAGIASDAAQRILESEEGKKRVAAGMAEVGRFLAGELTRK